MARLLFQYLAIYNIENVPNKIRNLPKYVQKFSKYLMGVLKCCQSRLKCCLSGEILLNLVALLASDAEHLSRRGLPSSSKPKFVQKA